MFEKNDKFLCDVIGEENYAENVLKRITEMYAVGVNNVSFIFFSYQIYFPIKYYIKCGSLHQFFFLSYFRKFSLILYKFSYL